jgi:hypothetical protein
LAIAYSAVWTGYASFISDNNSHSWNHPSTGRIVSIPQSWYKLTNVGDVGRSPCHCCLQQLTLSWYMLWPMLDLTKASVRQKSQRTLGLLLLTTVLRVTLAQFQIPPCSAKGNRCRSSQLGIEHAVLSYQTRQVLVHLQCRKSTSLVHHADGRNHGVRRNLPKWRSCDYNKSPWHILGSIYYVSSI